MIKSPFLTLSQARESHCYSLIKTIEDTKKPSQKNKVPDI